MWNLSVPSEPVIDHVTKRTNSLELTWKPPLEPNGIITEVRLCWRLTEESNKTCEVFSAGVSWYGIKNLSK